MSALYEIELINEAADHHHIRICEGPDAPAGEVPASVTAYAAMLRSHTGPGTEVNIGLTMLTRLDENGVTANAWTCWLTHLE